MSITRLSGGLTPADGSDPRTFPEIFNGFADEFEDKNLPAFSAVAPTDGQVPVFDAVEGVFVPGEGGGLPSNAFAFVGTVPFESNGQFSKGDFPFLRAVRVKCQGAGGGGGAPSGATRAGGGGGSGGFAESFITNIPALASLITVNVGLGGTGGDSTGQENGDDGGTSSFGTLVSATGGAGTINNGRFTADGGVGTAGDLLIGGSAALNGSSVDPSPSSPGAPSFLGGGGRGRAFSGQNGFPGRNFGGGGGGATSGSTTATTGGDGADGIVIVELFA